MTSIIKKTWRQAGIYAVGTLLLSVGQLALAPLLTRRLGLAEFGFYEILLVTYIAMRALLIIPLSSSLVYGYCKHCQTANERRDLLSTINLLSLFISFAMMITGLLLPQWPSWFIGPENVSPLIGPLILFALAFEVFIQIALGLFRAVQQPLFYGLIALTQLLCRLTLTGILVGNYDWKLDGVFASMCISNLIATAALFIILRRRMSARFNLISMKPVMAFALTMFPMNVANLILSVSDRYFLSSFWEFETVGVYALTYRLGTGISMLIVFPFLTAWPALIYSEQDSNKIGEHVGKAALNLWMIGMLFVVAVSAAAKPLLLLFGGSKFLAGTNLLSLIALGSLLSGVTGVFMSSVVAKGYILLNMKVLLSASCLALALNALMIPKFGMTGAALATVSSYLFGAVLSLLAAKKSGPLKFNLQTWLKITVGGLFALILGRLACGISCYTTLNLLTATSISAITYIVFLRLFGFFPTEIFKSKL